MSCPEEVYKRAGIQETGSKAWKPQSWDTCSILDTNVDNVEIEGNQQLENSVRRLKLHLNEEFYSIQFRKYCGTRMFTAPKILAPSLQMTSNIMASLSSSPVSWTDHAHVKRTPTLNRHRRDAAFHIKLVTRATYFKILSKSHSRKCGRAQWNHVRPNSILYMKTWHDFVLDTQLKDRCGIRYHHQ